MNEYVCTRPQLRELLSIIGIYPLKTEPHSRIKGWEQWIYNRDDVRTDTAINTYYALLELQKQRNQK
jgi:hypothetical protein